jgi:hypothetical protein
MNNKYLKKIITKTFDTQNENKIKEYYNKYMKYKNKYLELRGGADNNGYEYNPGADVCIKTKKNIIDEIFKSGIDDYLIEDYLRVILESPVNEENEKKVNKKAIYGLVLDINTEIQQHHGYEFKIIENRTNKDNCNIIMLKNYIISLKNEDKRKEYATNTFINIHKKINEYIITKLKAIRYKDIDPENIITSDTFKYFTQFQAVLNESNLINNIFELYIKTYMSKI